MFPDLTLGRGVFVMSAALAVTAIIGWRLAFGWIVARVGTA